MLDLMRYLWSRFQQSRRDFLMEDALRLLRKADCVVTVVRDDDRDPPPIVELRAVRTDTKLDLTGKRRVYP